jgi:hypothetical protein
VNLTQSQQAKNLSDLRVHSVDTADADNEGDLGFGLPVESTSLAGAAVQLDQRGPGRVP